MVNDFSCSKLCLFLVPVEQAGTGSTVSSHTTDAIHSSLPKTSSRVSDKDHVIPGLSKDIAQRGIQEYKDNYVNNI